MGCCTKHLHDILAQNLYFLPRLLVKTTHAHPVLPVLHGDLHLPWVGTFLHVNKPLLALVVVYTLLRGQKIKHCCEHS